MPLISIDKLSIQNFGPYAEAEWELRANGITAITGRMNRRGFADNMCGKTKLLTALVWCFYGKTLEGGRDADSIVKEGSEGGTCVVVGLTIDGRKWAVSRYRQHSKNKNKLLLVEWFSKGNMESHTYGTNDMTQTAVDALLGTFEEFCADVVYSASSPLSTLAEMKGSKIKELLSGLLGLGRFEAAERRAKNKIGVAIEERVKNEEKMQELRGGWKEVRRSIRTLCPPDPLPEFDFDSVEEDIKRLQERCNRLLAKVASREEKREELEDAIRDQAEAKSEYKRAVRRREQLKSSRCPECGKPIKPDKKSIRKATRLLKQAAYHSDLADMEVTAKKNQLKSNPKEDEVRVNLEVRLAQLREQWDAATKAKRVHGRAVSAYQTDSMSLKDRLCNLEDNLEHGKIQSHKLVRQERRYGFWAEHFGSRGIRSHLFDGYLAVVSQRATDRARTFYGPDAYINITPTTVAKDNTERDDIDIRVNLPGFSPYYENISRGGRQRVNLCILLGRIDAARTSRRSWRQLFVDEVMDGMDEPGSLLAVHAIKELAQDRQVVVVTRNPKIIAAADQVLVAVHDGALPYGTTTLEQV